ncbi:hypothetical protein ACFPA8_07770 [Streptomyces ovatisporus]|uniref:Uncharacterized protein n=1 Tax=Streptomyces ovatisporus TaxID=1128682 RepID=A0ABV9A658_9ACTN
MARKDRYSADIDPKKCGHPNQVPFGVKDKTAATGKALHVKCGDDKRLGCGEEWPK